MSLFVLNIVQEKFPRGGSELAFLRVFADFANHSGGNIFVSMARMAIELRMSKRQVQRIKQKLLDERYIFITKNEHGGRTTTRYRVNLELLASLPSIRPSVKPDDTDVAPHRDVTGDASVGHGVTSASGDGRHACHPIHQLNVNLIHQPNNIAASNVVSVQFRKPLEEKIARNSASQISSGWYPNPEALKILDLAGINRDFIDDAVPEFVLYWRELGVSDHTWSSKFVTHIRRQWARFENTREHEQAPQPISATWKPNEDVYDILRMANIDIAFARETLKTFILFWRDAGTPQRSWNTKFLEHVKYKWDTRNHLVGVNCAGSAIAAGVSATTPSNAFERLTDRSWASGIVAKVES